ncbi:hypothetical protein A3C89_03560 [Candidatus Kaiserbacteria bacterium RIFCSPHIGHO2_02_FULL_50_50]|uniref:Uncharacterized protein n=1 Tax=Candidatus Kaiserbacteria bacterium RIFCSPHIGHO2_02_FULL_50_50 TaxID=1798492 RepID=A0A1F6DC92_9BACT|nr:MAG: hypothetical protein A3C89_03560 [Candidatus Kaiserbacteria bacterium RIFCSPHIGHO2_02_FULL_50_50]OGG88538.1 MAG: hypothetical protein A3G62_03450 [Candidatus Kaiserbacteria bacterium RIFCSPLOWO2_12_FULL_50_10]
MEKEFDAWNARKKITEQEINRLYTAREVWWCRLGENIGTEQNGKGEWFARPCIIMRGFGPDACLVVPISTSARNHPMRPSVGVVDGKNARANISQIRVIDTKRLAQRIGFLEEAEFLALKKIIGNLFR